MSRAERACELPAPPRTRQSPMELAHRYLHRGGGASARALICAGALAGVGGLSVAAVNASDRTVLILGIATVLALPIATRIIRRRFDPFEPLVIVVLAYAAMFVVRPIAMIAQHDFAYSSVAGSTIGPFVNLTRGFNSMLAIALIGALAFVAGYSVSAGGFLARHFSPPRPVTNVAYSASIALLFGLLGTALFAELILSGGGKSALLLLLQGRSVAQSQLLTRSVKYFLYGPLLLLPTSLVLIRLGTWIRSRLIIALGILSGLILVLMAAPSGSRSELFTFAAGLGILFYVSRDRRPPVPALVVCIAIALTLSSVILQLRTAGPTRAAGIGAALSSLASNPLSVFAPITTQNDAAEAPGLAAALSLPPGELPETYGGSTVGDLLTRGIPRSLWPGKPYTPRQRITALLLGDRNTYVNDESPEFSVLLYPYLDFRLPGVALFMFCYGIAVRALWEFFRLHRHTLFAQLLLALAAPQLLAGMRDGPVDTTVQVLFLLIPLWLAFRPGLLSARLVRSSGVVRSPRSPDHTTTVVSARNPSGLA